MTARGRRNQRANPECPYRPATCVLGAATHHQDHGLQDWGTAGARCQVSGVRAITKNADCRMVEAPGRWLRRLSGNPTEELMDSRAFKASRSRRGNEIESRMSVFSITKTRGRVVQGRPILQTPRDLPKANEEHVPLRIREAEDHRQGYPLHSGDRNRLWSGNDWVWLAG